MSTPTKKRGRRKKDATAIVAQELSQIAGEKSSDNTTIESNNTQDADEINISFGSSSAPKKPSATSKKKTEQKIDTTAEKRSVSFGGLNITVHSAPATDIKSVAHSLRFGSQTADNSAETRERSGSGDKIIHGQIEKKTTLRSTPSRMCEIVEHDSTDDEIETQKNDATDDQISVRSGGTETQQPTPFIWNRPDENTRHVNLSQRIGQVFEQHGKTELPTTSNIWCWWCCHNFDTTPCFMPTFYDDIRKRYIVVGNFCSWPCVKAYNVDQKDMCIHKRNAMLRTMLRRCGVKSEQIKTAPPRSALRTMGGNLNIDEFRKSSGVYEMMKPLSSMTICIEPQTLLKKTQKLLVKR